MRIRMAFLSCTVVAMAALLAPTAALATGSSCSTFNPGITVLRGPCPVSGTNPTECEAAWPAPPALSYTGIQYQVTNTGGVDHVAGLVTKNNATGVVVNGPGNQVLSACLGDPVTGLGKHSCHERAFKVNPNAATIQFWVVVPGQKEGVLLSLAAKKGSCVKAKDVMGLGFDAPVAPVTEILTHGECSVEFTMNALTGTVIQAKLTEASLDAGCNSPNFDPDTGVLNPRPTSAIEVKVDGVNLDDLVYGDGFFQSGATSCTTKIVGGKVYTYGKPCP